MGWLKRMFGTDSKQALAYETIEERVVVQAVKKPHYHEIVGGTVRIYHRQHGLVEEVDGGADPYAVALELLHNYNGGA